MNEFDKFVVEDGESLTSVDERFSTLINIMDRNQVKPFEISINTKLLNSLQPEWSKYVTLTSQKFILEKEYYDMLLATKYEAGVHLDEEDNDFMLVNAYGDDTLEELNASDLQKQISVEQETIEKLQNEKDKIRDRFLKARDESLNIKNETESFKKAFKVREDKYLDDIVTLEENSNLMNVVFKMSHHFKQYMLGTTPNSFYDRNLKAGLGYKNPERLKKSIEAQPKMYNGKNLKYHELKVNLPNYEETLEDIKKSRLKMKDKMIPLDYSKLNKLYDLFVP
ncbi:hypothetical protein Tco_1244195 [Tanacetum coccineum]